MKANMKNLNTPAPKTEPKTELTKPTESTTATAAVSAPENPVAPVNPVSTLPPVDVKAAIAKAKQLEQDLQTGVVAARDALGFALRVMIGNDVPGTDAGRLLVENAFETTKQAAAGGKATRADLVAATAGLQHAENNLANRSLKFPADLATVRSSVQKANKLLELIAE